MLNQTPLIDHGLGYFLHQPKHGGDLGGGGGGWLGGDCDDASGADDGARRFVRGQVSVRAGERDEPVQERSKVMLIINPNPRPTPHDSLLWDALTLMPWLGLA